MKRLSTLLVLIVPLFAAAQEKITFEVAGGKLDERNVPIRISLKATKKLADYKGARVFAGDAKIALGQLTPPDDKTGGRDLVFILPELKAGATRKLQAELTTGEEAGPHFAWVKKSDDYADLELKDGTSRRPVMRYMHAAFDDSTKEKRNRTYKVFHHLWDPDGKRFVTNGGQTDPHTDPKKLLYPHHRGLMFGFNKVTYGDKKAADTWHCTGDAHLSHEAFMTEEAGPVFASHTVCVAWHGVKKEIFAEEARKLTVYNVPGGTLIDADITLTTTGGKVHLDGDPQHAGFQFRAANDVSMPENAKQTYYLRPDGKGKLGETRNWDAKKGGPVNLPWNVMSFVIDGQRYSVLYIDHPDNPGEKRYSERDYGRFGCYFAYDLTKEHPLHVRYRVWLQKGEMTAEQAEAMREAFVLGPRVK